MLKEFNDGCVLCCCGCSVERGVRLPRGFLLLSPDSTSVSGHHHEEVHILCMSLYQTLVALGSVHCAKCNELTKT